MTYSRYSATIAIINRSFLNKRCCLHRCGFNLKLTKRFYFDRYFGLLNILNEIFVTEDKKNIESDYSQ